MRILFVTQYDLLNPAAGGPVYKVRALSKHLARRGHSVTIITAKANTEFADQDKLQFGEWEERIRIIRLSTLLRYRAVTVNPGAWLAARREIPRVDVIHLFGFYDLLGPVVAHAAKANDVPYVLEPIGMLIPIVRSLRKKRLYHRWFGRRLVEDAVRVVATSSQEKNELVQAGIPVERIVQRRNGIDLTEFSDLPERGRLRRKLGITSEERVLLYLSRLSAKKNPDMLLRAFAELDLPDTRLLMVGPHENGYLKQLQRLGETLGLDRKVVFTGPLYGQEKLSALVDADLFILPSQNENFGNVIAEAIATSTPVVITDQCGIAEHIRDRAGLVVAVEKTAVRDAIARLLLDAALYATLTDECQDVARELSWEQPVRQMESVYMEASAGIL